jgi:hypothetical protein
MEEAPRSCGKAAGSSQKYAAMPKAQKNKAYLCRKPV